MFMITYGPLLPRLEIAHFIAMPFDLPDHGLVAGEPFKCATPASAIERAKGCWKVFGHAGAIAFVRTGYPETNNRAQEIWNGA